MEHLCTIRASELKSQYELYGIDISRIIGEIKEFELLEDENGLRYWNPPAIGDSEFYSQLAKNIPWYYQSDKEEYGIAKNYIQEGPVLEIGCGEGQFALKQNITTYTGLELNQEAVLKGKKKGLNLILEDFRDYATKHPESAATICSFQVLEHLPSPDIFFRSANRILKDDGIIITSVPSEDSFIGTLKDNCLNAPPHHITRWTNQCLRQLPQQYGFECVDIIHIPVEPCHYGWFWSTLLERALKQNEKEAGLKLKLKYKLAMKILKSLGVTNFVPKDFRIPGHTVLAVHKKVDTLPAN